MSVIAPPGNRTGDPALNETPGRGKAAWRFAVAENIWPAGTLLIAAIVAAPVLAVFWLALNPAENIWPHLFATVLDTYVIYTLGLGIGVALLTATLGTATAWLVTMCAFPGRRLFEWALIVPLAVPTYIIAYTYTDFLEYAGPVQSALRDLFGWTSKRDYWFPEIRSLGGAIFVMSCVLYPYVYLMARSSFINQCICVLEVSRTLGRGPWATFFHVALPLARPAIMIGVILAVMETLNDFGAVDYFAVPTLTRAIYGTWLDMGNLGGGAQIACVLLIFVLTLIGLERAARRGQRFHHTSTKMRPLPDYRLGPLAAAGAIALCAAPVVLGFVIPGAVLLDMALANFGRSWSADYAAYAFNSLILSVTAALVAVAVGIFLAYSVRLSSRRPGVAQLTAGATRLASLGYAIPGAVLGIGILIPLATLDNSVDRFMEATFGISTGLLLTGSIAAIVFAYLVRFLALAFGALESGLERVTPSMDMAARALGYSAGRALLKVHLPLVRGSLLTAAVLVFVDSMKELPATLILRPFNFDTLATHVYTYASLEQLEASALAALTIVLVGIVPVILLSRSIAASRPGQPAAERTVQPAPPLANRPAD